MLTNDSDRTWRFFGAKDPYFGVLTADRFKGELDVEARNAFFDSGRKHVEAVIGAIRASVDPSFAPRRALDFGCGVGRLVLPLAKASTSVVGVDVSQGMLDEAAKNAELAGIDNASFVLGDDELTGVTGTFDLIHSFIVFQHIPPERGEKILRALMKRVEPGGVGALQFTFRHDASLARRALITAYQRVPGLYALRNVLKGKAALEPMMQMNLYDMNRLLDLLKECGATRITVEFTETSHFASPLTGAFLFFQKAGSGAKWGA